MDVQIAAQNPCRVRIPDVRTTKSVAAMFHSLAIQLERHPSDARVLKLHFVQADRSIQVDIELVESST